MLEGVLTGGGWKGWQPSHPQSWSLSPEKALKAAKTLLYLSSFTQWQGVDLRAHKGIITIEIKEGTGPGVGDIN